MAVQGIQFQSSDDKQHGQSNSKAWLLEWTEYDEGAQRDGGATIHLSAEDARNFEQAYYRKHHTSENAPAWYMRASGRPQQIEVAPEIYRRLLEQKLIAESDESPDGMWASLKRPEIPRIEVSIHSPDSVFKERLVLKARAQAEQDFKGVYRKAPTQPDQPKIPYFNHVDCVARLLAEAGMDRAVVAAGYLHDHLEDLPKQWDKARMMAEFGEPVTGLVDWVTQQNKRLSWEKRNQLYNERLKSAPDEAVALSCADKISNISDYNRMMRQGHSINVISKQGWRPNSEKFHELGEIFAVRAPKILFQRFELELAEFDALGIALKGGN